MFQSQVITRTRPFLRHEVSESPGPHQACTEIGQNGKQVSVRGTNETFGFHASYPDSAPLSSIWKSHVHPLLETTLRGQNTALVSYGAASAGKSFVLDGEPQQPGLVPLSLEAFSRYMESQPEGTVTMTVSAFLVQADESVVDIMQRDPVKRGHLKGRVLTDPAMLRRGVLVDGIDAIQVTSREEAMQLLRSAQEQSSWSNAHRVVLATIEHWAPPSAPEHRSGEPLLSGTMLMTETATPAPGSNPDWIGALQGVMCALEARQPRVEYSRSKITQLLKETWSGVMPTTFIATVSPSSEPRELRDTLATLMFARRVQTVWQTLEAARDDYNAQLEQAAFEENIMAAQAPDDAGDVLEASDLDRAHSPEKPAPAPAAALAARGGQTPAAQGRANMTPARAALATARGVVAGSHATPNSRGGLGSYRGGASQARPMSASRLSRPDNGGGGGGGGSRPFGSVARQGVGLDPGRQGFGSSSRFGTGLDRTGLDPRTPKPRSAPVPAPMTSKRLSPPAPGRATGLRASRTATVAAAAELTARDLYAGAGAGLEDTLSSVMSEVSALESDTTRGGPAAKKAAVAGIMTRLTEASEEVFDLKKRVVELEAAAAVGTVQGRTPAGGASHRSRLNATGGGGGATVLSMSAAGGAASGGGGTSERQMSGGGGADLDERYRKLKAASHTMAQEYQTYKDVMEKVVQRMTSEGERVEEGRAKVLRDLKMCEGRLRSAQNDASVAQREAAKQRREVEVGRAERAQMKREADAAIVGLKKRIGAAEKKAGVGSGYGQGGSLSPSSSDFGDTGGHRSLHKDADHAVGGVGGGGGGGSSDMQAEYEAALSAAGERMSARHAEEIDELRLEIEGHVNSTASFSRQQTELQAELRQRDELVESLRFQLQDAGS